MNNMESNIESNIESNMESNVESNVEYNKNDINNNKLFELIYIDHLINLRYVTDYRKRKYVNRLNVLNSFKFYQEIVTNKNFLLIDLFIKCKKYYNIIVKFVKFLKFKNNIYYNNEDLICNYIINCKYVFKIYIDKFVYQFTYNDFVKIINNSLLNYTLIENSDTIDSVLIKPNHIKNPYTNLNFNISVLYNFYNFCINNNKQIPLLFKLFYNENFNLKNFFLIHQTYIVSNAYKVYIKNSTSSVKYKILLSLINTFVNFISKYIKNFSIKYLLSNYKIKFHSLTDNEIDYYNNYLQDYMMLIYYYKHKQYKNCIDIKLKLVFKLLCDTHIKVVDSFFSNLIFTKINENYIINYLLTNLENIFSNEISIMENDIYFFRLLEENNEISENNETSENNELNETSENNENNENYELNETSENNENNENCELNETSENNENNELNETNILTSNIIENNINNTNLYSKYELLIKKFLRINNLKFNSIYNNYNILLLKLFIINIQIYINLLIVNNIYQEFKEFLFK